MKTLYTIYVKKEKGDAWHFFVDGLNTEEMGQIAGHIRDSKKYAGIRIEYSVVIDQEIF